MNSETGGNSPITQATAFCMFIKRNLTLCFVDYVITTLSIEINVNFNHEMKLSFEDILTELDESMKDFNMNDFGWSNFFVRLNSLTEFEEYDRQWEYISVKQTD